MTCMFAEEGAFKQLVSRISLLIVALHQVLGSLKTAKLSVLRYLQLISDCDSIEHVDHSVSILGIAIL
jgi:hypothetical protein